MAPIVVAFVGIALSLVAFWFAQAADDRRVRAVLDSRSDWLARDIEAKIQLSGNAVESLAIALAANPRLDTAQFARVAARARHGLLHVNALQWAPRVAREDIAAFEQAVRASGRPDYQVFDVTPDFRRTALGDRAEYFPVLYDTRFGEGRHVPGLALGLHEGRGLPMQKARAEGRPVATLPVRPIGAPTPRLVYLLFWPVYEDVDIPVTAEARQATLRGFALGNYDVAALLTEVLREAPQLPDAIAFAIGPATAGGPPAETVATYAASNGRVATAPAAAAVATAQQAERAFTVFDQHWRITFGYSAAAADALRSQSAWGWLLAGALLTAFLTFYLIRARDRAATVAALVEERTTELQRTSAQLQQAQKMEAIGNLTGGMAHDFNNLLSVTIGTLDVLQDRLRHDPEALALAEQAMQASLRGADLTRQLLAFARRQPLQPSVVNVNELVAGMTRLLKRILEEDIEVVLIAAAAVWPVLIDPSQLNAAIANLATNARDAMPAGGRLTIETRNVQLDADYAAANPEVMPGDFVLIEVSDTGTGMSAEALSRAFEPFFTTKKAGRGTGLGLSMVFGFVKQSQGHIKIYSELGQGTTVRLYLPRAEATSATEAPPPAPPPVAAAGHETILVVDDNAPVRATVARQLTELGYQVVEAENGQAALAVLADPARAIDVLFTDLVMPGGINGHDLARAAAAARPGLRVLYTSGYSSGTLRGDDRLKENEHFLSKPYRKAELARKLREVIGR